MAFVTMKGFETVKKDLLPTNRYINLIKDGAHEMGLNTEYTNWLD